VCLGYEVNSKAMCTSAQKLINGKNEVSKGQTELPKDLTLSALRVQGTNRESKLSNSNHKLNIVSEFNSFPATC
jgi:hypothetical protein